MRIILGSNNRHKQREIQEMIDSRMPEFVELVLPEDVIAKKIEVEENGESIEENAYIKASAFHDLTKMPCIADDTGLEIDALKGAPGVHSARFADEYGNDAKNRKKVLKLLKDVPLDKRTAQFRTLICFINKDRSRYIEGVCKGKITFEERGKNGFGYDSIFIPDGYTLTFAEMSPEQKNHISHRGKAIRNFVEFIKLFYYNGSFK